MPGNDLELAINFIRDNGSDIPSVIPTAKVASASVQTGDISFAFIIALLVLAVMVDVVIAYAVIRRRQLSGNVNATNSRFSFSNLSIGPKFAAIFTGVVVLGCIALGCVGLNANAKSGTSPFACDPQTITAKVADDGTVTIDTCTLTNIDEKYDYTISESAVFYTEDVKDIEGIDKTSMKISGFDGTLFGGNVVDLEEGGEPYTPSGLSALEPNGKTQLKLDISFVKILI